ncbi:fasciclin domain-containing protein [Viscerimonas tarda]
MKTINKFRSRIAIFSYLAIVVGLLGFVSCEKDVDDQFQVSDELMLDEIMEGKAELSSFLQIIEIGNMRGTVHAYGTYTLFAPTNEAVDAYLGRVGKTLPALSKEEAEEIVKYHLVPDTIPTADFIDGRLASANFLKKYITTKTEDEAGDVFIRVNRQARIAEKDLRGANGYLHKIDNVLTPPAQSITDVVQSLDPIQYGLFKEIFNRTSLGETLDTLGERGLWFTYFVQDNDSYAEAGISSVEDLLVRLRKNTPDITDDNQLLFNYVAYHCVSGLNYVADLLMQSSLQTIVQNQVLSLKRDVDKVYVNYFNINGQIEPGALVDRESAYTDLSCSNGVIHKINGNIEIVKRAAYRVYWDIAEQPEIMSLKNFRKAGTSVAFAKGELSEIEFGGKNPGALTYNANGYATTVTKDNNYVNGDNISFRIDVAATIQWVNFTLPLLVEGKYKVWVGLRYANTDSSTKRADIRTIFKQTGQDDQILGITTFDYTKKPSSYSMTDVDDAFHAKLESEGQRLYTMSLKKNPDTANACFLVGIIDVATTGRHILRIEGVTDARFAPMWDVIHFIPLEEDQVWPKQDIRGNMIYRDTPWCQIWPYSECEEAPVEGEE